MGLALLSCDRELPTIKRDPRSGARGEDWKALRLVLPGRQLVCRIRLPAVKTARRHTHGVSSTTVAVLVRRPMDRQSRLAGWTPSDCRHTVVPTHCVPLAGVMSGQGPSAPPGS